MALLNPYFWGGYVGGGVGWPAMTIHNNFMYTFQTYNLETEGYWKWCLRRAISVQTWGVFGNMLNFRGKNVFGEPGEPSFERLPRHGHTFTGKRIECLYIHVKHHHTKNTGCHIRAPSKRCQLSPKGWKIDTFRNHLAPRLEGAGILYMNMI